MIIDRLKDTAFSHEVKKIPQTHVLDLDKSGVIKPHIDSVRVSI